MDLVGPHISIQPAFSALFVSVSVSLYSISTVAPSSFSVATIFSASSFGTESFISLGALSTNFLESTRLSPSRFLTSLMTLGFAAASNLTSLTLNRVFSWAAGASSSASAAAAAAGAAAAGAAAKPPTGRSGMLSRDCVGSRSALYPTPQCYFDIVPLTFRLETRSAVSRRVNWLIWSTIPAILGFVGAAAAASVDWYRRDILCWARAPVLRRVEVERS